MKLKVVSILRIIASLAAVAALSGPLRASIDDDKIETVFKQTYVYQNYLKLDSIHIEVQKNGVVKLTGIVAGEIHKALAGETVAGLRGVTRVDNQLNTNTDLATQREDKLIEKRVMITLLFYASLNAARTTVAVQNGIVTLGGQASSADQKELTSQYVGYVAGVKDVKNEMTVTPPSTPTKWTAIEEIDDASITAQIKAALLIHRSIRSMQIKVETHDGVVTLVGNARNAAEKAMITGLVTDIHGVKGVNNEIAVQKAIPK